MNNKLICLDAGHGINTAGKRCMKSIDPNETREWWLNQRIAVYVEQGLSAYDCRVMRVDDVTGGYDITLADRVGMANSANADLYVSIHHNAGINGGSGGGICVFTCNNPSATSTALAKAVYVATVAKTGLKGNRATPLPRENFYVIYNTSMPAILGEFGFMDSTVDVPIILTDDFARKCAEGIVEGIATVAGFESVEPPGAPSEWAKDSCEWAQSLGIFRGDDKGNFNWRNPITREEAAVILHRYDKQRGI